MRNSDIITIDTNYDKQNEKLKVGMGKRVKKVQIMKNRNLIYLGLYAVVAYLLYKNILFECLFHVRPS